MVLQWTATHQAALAQRLLERGRTFWKAHCICASSWNRKGTESPAGSATMSCMPTLEMAAAWSWPTAIFRTISPSLPWVPPA